MGKSRGECKPPLWNARPSGTNRSDMIHTGTRSNAAGYVTLGLQTFEYTDNRSAREAVEASKVSRCRQLGSRRQPSFENRKT